MGVGMGSLIPAVRLKSRFYHQFADCAAFCIFDQLCILEAWPHFPHKKVSCNCQRSKNDDVLLSRAFSFPALRKQLDEPSQGGVDGRRVREIVPDILVKDNGTLFGNELVNYSRSIFPMHLYGVSFIAGRTVFAADASREVDRFDFIGINCLLHMPSFPLAVLGEN